MPMMTNPKTGETKEISMEEFMGAIQGRKISVCQEVRHDDGTVTSSLIYGNDIGDGVDRSLNIFGTTDDVLFYAVLKARKIKEADENAENLFFIDNSDADYEVTIDDTQSPVMHIITCTKEKVRVAHYIRDERKTVGKPISEGEYSFVNGKISATLEDVEKDNLMLFACGVYEIRKLLDERGLLQKLKELENRSSGVMVTKDGDEVEDESGIKTKIVRGHNRPDLPCMTFVGLFGRSVDAVMMRPYMDELIGEILHAGMSWEDKIKAAEEGDPDLMVDVAMYYLDECDEPDGEKAAYWFEKAANAGNSDAMFNTGLHYAKGFGVERNFEKSLYWMKKADENGDEDAENYIIRLTEAINAEKTADTGDAKAQAVLAEFYMYLGKSFDQAGNEKDYAKAFEYAKKSSDSNEGHGCWILALCYQHGRGVRPDARKAFELYQKGSDLGHAACQHSLACHYFRGEIVGQDFKKGFDLCMKSAKQGYGLAMADIGRCYQFGNGVEENMNVAIKWYEKSLEVEYDPELAEKVRIYKTFDDYEDVNI